MLTTAELITDIQGEVGECSSVSLELIGHLTSAESCETAEELKENILEAKGIALLILSNLNDQLSRLFSRINEESDKRQIDRTKHRVEHDAHRSGIHINVQTIPDVLWDLWLRQGQCLGQMVSLVNEFNRTNAGA